jgi:hypothetical protein
MLNLQLYLHRRTALLREYWLFALAFSREYRPPALNGLLSGNLDTAGHSQVCHPIQDRVLE